MVDLKLKIPEGFLEEEERCGYVVSKQMKEVWAVELDMFVELDRVCRKHNIKYFASGGTMLGAVRHKGFIPWDDDIDVMMLRSEYDKLCAVGPSEFKHPYFFQTEYTDPGSLRGHAQLRNSETTGILESEKTAKFKFNQGIFIDIFPLDNVPDDLNLFHKQGENALLFKKRYHKWSRWTDCRYIEASNAPKKIIKRCIYKLLRSIAHKVVNNNYRKFEDACKLYNNHKTSFIGPIGVFDFGEKHIKYREDYEESQYVDFEFVKMPIPVRYDHALRTYFGDYMVMQKAPSNHGGIFFDTDKSYKEYLNLIR